MSIAEKLRQLAIQYRDTETPGVPLYRDGLTIVDQMINIIKVLDSSANVSGIETIEDAVYPLIMTIVTGHAPLPHNASNSPITPPAGGE